MSASYSEIRDGMQIDWDVSIKVDDGLVLKAEWTEGIENNSIVVYLCGR